jgi:hypothetical protein
MALWPSPFSQPSFMSFSTIPAQHREEGLKFPLPIIFKDGMHELHLSVERTETRYLTGFALTLALSYAHDIRQ